jgi:hypothetical protein
MDLDLICSVCLYVQSRPDIDEDSHGELETLTVINGQMVCIRHASCANESHHATLMAGVHLESRGEFTSLSAYQDWRHKQQGTEEERDG